MEKATSRNFRLGIFVSAGTLFLIFLLYMIGAKRSLFSSNFRLSAEFHNVNGLMEGNNVRFSGINVGIVEKVDLSSDSTVRVTMLIENRVRKFIKKNAVASVGTDGLMGNKLVNINSPGDGTAQAVEDEDRLQTLKPIETDEMLRTLNTTNENIKWISADLRKVTSKLNNSNSMWNLLQDSALAGNFRQAVENVNVTSARAVNIAGELQEFSTAMNSGKGLAPALFNDPELSGKLKSAVVNLDAAGRNFVGVSKELTDITGRIKNGRGAAGMLLSDTLFSSDLKRSMKNVADGAAGFDENMKALQNTFPLKRYFRKKAQTSSAPHKP